MTTTWSPEQVASLNTCPAPEAPVIAPQQVEPILSGVDLWDLWPVQTRDGDVAEIAGGALFMILSAPAGDDPDDRHAIARIRLLHRDAEGRWHDYGALLPKGFAPGSREWAGSAVLDDDGLLTLYFTAAGRRDEPVLTFEQRLFEATTHLAVHDGRVVLGAWSSLRECVKPDGDAYVDDMAGGGEIGTIKAFRDPGYFRDPADGSEYLLFTGSLASSISAFNGAIGIARRVDHSCWSLLPPLVSADGLNNELERPHIVIHQGLYYLFWSTQAKVFAPDGPQGPTGLYGMVAGSMTGPWQPMNGSGLVFSNPERAPFQAFSWFVGKNLDVYSFVDHAGISLPPRNRCGTARFLWRNACPGADPSSRRSEQLGGHLIVAQGIASAPEGMAAGIEAGGTKFIVGVARSSSLPVKKIAIPTTDQATTLGQVSDWLRKRGPLRSIGIASFGPVELDPSSQKWGHITETPKAGWMDCDIAGYFKREFEVPVGFDTDVNGAALAEYVYGVGRDARSLVYITVGTGVGGGHIVDGAIVTGAGHLEMGHFYPRKHAKDWHFKGSCPYHGDCLEGLISGPAIERRWGARLSDLPEDHDGHQIVADYLAQLCHTVFAMTSAEIIVLGGGVMKTPRLYERVRARAAAISGFYFPARDRQTIVAPALHDASGLVGAIELGRRMIDERPRPSSAK